ncbi:MULTISPECIES: hypothetical protein, partial [unclassified Campylobacter]|uniref:hypothetical protein n=1 Tax=unclassified Campylobacter TaxID=2593542 RepID=UPI003D34B8FA
MKNTLFIFFITLFFSGCVGKYGCNKDFFSDRISVRGYTNIIEEWYIDKNNPNSRILRGRTADYGASVEKKKHNYIIKYFSGNCQPISKNDLFKIYTIGSVDRCWEARELSEKLGRYVSKDEYLQSINYEKKYLYTKDEAANYKVYKEITAKVFAIK